jgi:g-D-glutamyl-meso-diaminopimelate peptidase
MIKQIDYSYDKIIQELLSLSEKYSFFKLKVIGYSLLGRPIYAAIIGIEPNTVLHIGGFHGSERLTVTTLIIFLERICEALSNDADFFCTNARRALFGKSFAVIPCINPDGYEISRVGYSAAAQLSGSVLKIAGGSDLKYWNANARGVDINHNFDAEFEKLKQLEAKYGINCPAARRFGGASPESEPETKTAADFIRQNNIEKLLCFHSQGEEIYYSFGDIVPLKSEFLAMQFAAASGYKLAKPSGTAQFGGCKDWFIKNYNRPGFTLEIGLGENPLPPIDLFEIYRKIEPIFLLSMVL